VLLGGVCGDSSGGPLSVCQVHDCPAVSSMTTVSHDVLLLLQGIAYQGVHYYGTCHSSAAGVAGAAADLV